MGLGGLSTARQCAAVIPQHWGRGTVRTCIALGTSRGGTGLKRPIAEVMKRDPKRIRADELASEAMAVMQKYRIDELPVVDEDDRPVGLIDVQDLVVLKMLDVEPEK